MATPVARGGKQAFRVAGALADALQGTVNPLKRRAVGQYHGKALRFWRRTADGGKGCAVCGNGLCLSLAEVRQRIAMPLCPVARQQVIGTEIEHDPGIAAWPYRKLLQSLARAGMAIADGIDTAMQADRMRHRFGQVAEIAATYDIAQHRTGRIGGALLGDIQVGKEIHDAPASSRPSSPRPGIRLTS